MAKQGILADDDRVELLEGLEIHSDPTGPAERPDYRHHDDFSEAESVPLVIEGREVVQIPVRSVL